MTDGPLKKWTGFSMVGSDRVSHLVIESQALNGNLPAELRKVTTLTDLNPIDNSSHN